ncbi:MAG: hypothetical protein WCJ30_29000, partial [Deltaproteobacteria bacterium]
MSQTPLHLNAGRPSVRLAVSVSLALTLVAAGSLAHADPPASSAPPAGSSSSAVRSASSAPPASPAPAALLPPRAGEPSPMEHIPLLGDNAPVDYATRRYEPAGFPIIGGNTDIGFLIGGAVTLTRFQSGWRPYYWNMDLVVAASFKNGPAGIEVAQQAYRWQLDQIGVLGGRLRLNPAIFFLRTVNQGYFSLGNASSGNAPVGSDGRYFQITLNEFWAYLSVRTLIRRPFSFTMALVYRYVHPLAYENSALAIDMAAHEPDGSRRIYGAEPLHLATMSVGAQYDTRDSEIITHRGLGWGVWATFNRGFPFSADVAYASVGFSLAQYVTLWGPIVLAARVVGDFQFGNVPFYDLFRGATPYMIDMPGGEHAIRGVP